MNPDFLDMLSAFSAERVEFLLVRAVIGRAELIRNKKATGRAKDLANVAWLEGREV